MNVGETTYLAVFLKVEMLGELNTPVGLSIWDKILLIKSKRVHALRDKI